MWHVVCDLLPCWCHPPVVRIQGLLEIWPDWGLLIVQVFLAWCNKACLHFTAGKCVLRGVSFFKGHAFNPLFYWSFWCLITHTCFSSYFVPTNLCVSVTNLPILWPLPGSRQTPYLRWGTMPAQRWLVQLFTWLLFCPNDPGNATCWWRQQAIHPCLRYLLFGSRRGEALCIERNLRVLTGILYTVSRAEPSQRGSLQSDRPVPSERCRPSISLGRRDPLETAGLFTEELPQRWEKLVLGTTQLRLLLQTRAAGCTPAASAHSQGGPFLFICTACLGLALSESFWVRSWWSSSPWWGWLNEAQNMFWFGERKDLFLDRHIFLSNWLLCTRMVPYKLCKTLTSVVPTALQNSLKELTIFIVQLSSILLDEWSSSFQ